MRRIWIAVLTAVLLSPATASAGLVLGLRTGVSRTGGSFMAGDKMTDAAATMIPVQLDAGWKFLGRLTVSGFFDMNLGLVSGQFKATCDASGSDCSANQSRVGGQVQWNFSPTRQLDPWVGAAVAWEVLGLEETSGTSGTNVNLQGTGWDVQAGFDYWLRRWLSVSPYVSLSRGTYGEAKGTFSEWQPIPDKAAHYLFTVGVRLGFELLGGSPRAEPASSPEPIGK